VNGQRREGRPGEYRTPCIGRLVIEKGAKEELSSWISGAVLLLETAHLIKGFKPVAASREAYKVLEIE
jgi:hypothetical protein